MGTVIHDAIVVTSWDVKKVEEAHKFASELMNHVSPLVPYIVNFGSSFMIAPDGSKEYWPQSDDADVSRQKFLDWVKAQDEDEGDGYVSNPFEIAIVRFGRDLDLE